jgi:hypothetical protein
VGALSTFSVEHLPPLMLSFTLPEGYPERTPPEICLACAYLTPQQVTVKKQDGGEQTTKARRGGTEETQTHGSMNRNGLEGAL